MITINVVSNEGHTEIQYDNALEACERIKQEVSYGNKWAYLDSLAVDVTSLTEKMVERANYIVLTNPLIGG